MIKVNVEEIINAVPTLKIIGQEQFNGVEAFTIARLIRELNKEIESFEQIHSQLIEKYCERNENDDMEVDENNNVRIQAKYVDKYNTEINTILKNEIEINAEPISIDCLKTLTLTPQQALSLESFFN